MDTSEKYILKCGEAKEIQKLWKPLAGDFVTCDNPEDRRVVIITTGEIDLKKNPDFLDVIFPFSYGNNSDYKRKDKMIWIPRQDQLQELIKRSDMTKALHQIYEAAEFLWFKNKSGTMEQLWLAFIMKEKYNKIWNDVKEIWGEGENK